MLIMWLEKDLLQYMQEGQDIQVRDDEDSDEEGAQQQEDGQDSPDR